MKFIDYYKVLEVPFNCSQEEIKRGFKTQAIKWHPDKNIGSDTTKRMQLINEANLILSDIEARKRYNIEYLRFRVLISDNKENNHKSNKEQQNKSSKTEYNYEYQDEILKDWISKAKEQAIEYAKQTIKEIRELSYTGIKEGGKEMGRYLIAFILISLLFSLIFAILN